MDYLTLTEFKQRFRSLANLVGGEGKDPAARTALQHAHAHIDAQLAKRYATPLPLTQLPNDAQEMVRRWVFYLAVRELLAAHGVVINREDTSYLADLLDLVDEQIRDYTEGGRVLPLPARSRVHVGYGTLAEG